jgi:hypothetical protein
MKPDVDPAVQQAAMKKMFSDPHFNVMDGLDIYIDDYSKPDPIPLEMLKKLNQSELLGLFKSSEDEDKKSDAPKVDQDNKHLLPDETPSDANNTNSVNSLESNKTQEEVGSNQSKPADSAS